MNRLNIVLNYIQIKQIPNYRTALITMVFLTFLVSTKLGKADQYYKEITDKNDNAFPMTRRIKRQKEEQSDALDNVDLIPLEFAKPRTSITLRLKKGLYMVRRRKIQRRNNKTNKHNIKFRIKSIITFIITCN